MIPFDYINQLIFDFKKINDLTSVLFTLVVGVGLLAILFSSVKLLLTLCQAFRLYVWSQFCCNYNTLKYGEWVVVTGATDGIGQSMAKEFARRGHSIVVVGRNGEKLARTKMLLESEPDVGQVETIQIDLSDSSLENYEQIKKLLDADNRDIGILVNNAGTATDKYMRYADYDMESIRCTVNVNALATAYFARIILPGMLARRRGLIVNVSSLMGEMQTGYFSVYNATKSFVNSFSRTVQLEYSSYPIDIINLTPGAVHTKMLAYLNISKPTIIMPSSDQYARSAIRAARTRASSYSGYWAHGMSKIYTDWCEYFGLMHGTFLLFARWNNQTISPPVANENEKNSYI